MSEADVASQLLRGLPPLLTRSFYQRPADQVAPELLGKLLVVTRVESAIDAPTMVDEPAPLVARIVETEAYLGEEDLACHAAKGLTERTKTIFGPPGHAYVYLIYGMYDMFNVVAERTGVPHAVLVRAVELPRGLNVAGAARTARGDGPGRLTRALGITRGAHNALPLDRPPLSIHQGEAPGDIGVSARVGVAYAGAWANAPLRYFDRGSKAVSRPSPRQLGSGAPTNS